MEQIERLRARVIDIETGRPVVLLNEADASKLSIHVGDRVYLSAEGKRKGEVAIVDVTDTMVREGAVGIFEDLSKRAKIKSGEMVRVLPREKPASVSYIRKKIDGKELSKSEIDAIIKDIARESLSDIELTSFVTASYIHGFSKREVVSLTWSMVNTGDRLDFDGITVDKHCIGGVPGNRTTMLIVPIVASFGVKMPKTSSRAITSPAGTADTMEILAPVTFDARGVRRIVEKVGACIVWGGGLSLAPADDKIIRVEYPLSIDAEGQLLASIISKKKSVGSDYVIIDIPCGRGAKIEKKKEARRLGKKFIELGREVEMRVEYVITDGSHPIGRGIGPVLEARDVLLSLNGEGPKDLVDKAVMLAGRLLEFSGLAGRGKGKKMAREAIDSQGAFRKMQEIIQVQGGNPGIALEDLKPGRFSYRVLAPASGRIKHISNSHISQIARLLGTPRDKKAGLFLNKQIGDKVEEGEVLYTLYAENPIKLRYARRAIKENSGISIV